MEDVVELRRRLLMKQLENAELEHEYLVLKRKKLQQQLLDPLDVNENSE